MRPHTLDNPCGDADNEAISQTAFLNKMSIKKPPRLDVYRREKRGHLIQWIQPLTRCTVSSAHKFDSKQL